MAGHIEHRGIRGLLLIAAFLPFVLFSRGLAGQAQGERYTLGGDAAIYNIAGTVTIEAGTGSETVVEVTRGGADRERLRIEDGEIEGWQTLRIIYPDERVVYERMSSGSRTQFDIAENGTFGRTWTAGEDEDDFTWRSLLRILGIGERGRVTVSGSGGGLEAHADLRVLVPRGGTVAVNLGVGEVQASNVEGDLLVDTRSGQVTASRLRGSARLSTGSGEIRLDGAEGNVVLDTGSGDIRVANVTGDRLLVDTGSGDVDGTNLRAPSLDIDTGSGSVEVTGLVAEDLVIDTGSGGITILDAEANDVTLDTGSGSVSAELRNRPRRVMIDTGSGGVTLTVPPDVGATLDLSTGSGGISTDLPVRITEKKRDELRGTVGDGSGRIEIDTGSGSIRIRSR